MLPAQLAVETARQGVVDLEDLVREKRPGRALGQETKRTEVSPAAFGMVVADEFYRVGIEQLEIQGLDLVVHQGRQDRVFFPGLGVPDGLRRDGGNRGARLNGHLLASGQCDSESIH